MNKFAFFWNEFVCQYPCTVGCNFWHSPGSRFTAKFGMGTPPKNKSVSDALPSWRGPRPNRWSAPLGRHVEKELNYIFFCGNWCPNTIKPLDATFGSRRGAVLQQNSESAHLPGIKVSLTRYQLGLGLDRIDGMHNLAGTWRKNQFFFLRMTWS